MERSHARRLLAKADEFALCARTELAAERYSAAGLAAVHAAIAAADAVTAHTAGVVSTGTSHFAVVQLLQQCLPEGLPTSAERQLLGLLRSKNDIEYTERALTGPETHVLVDQAVRFVRWSHRVAGGRGDLAP
ncbi:MAG: hypothetical protein IBX63_07515 [Coriobacteriia bacterium]|nr:hypothetical protein [Coriobacteriia bacterium]